MIYREELIYDIGAFDGQDTLYYLYKGYDVLFVEADPQLYNELTIMFNKEIHQGKVIPINKALDSTMGIKNFYLNKGTKEWNSLNPALGHRRQDGGDRIEVETVTITDLFSEFGVPYYMKMDIEGMEFDCLRNMDKDSIPQFISVEFSNPNLLPLLYDKGYRKFQLVKQENHPPDGDFKFKSYPCPSGKLPYLLPRDKWMEGNKIIDTYNLLIKDGGWYDLHATL